MKKIKLENIAGTTMAELTDNQTALYRLMSEKSRPIMRQRIKTLLKSGYELASVTIEFKPKPTPDKRFWDTKYIELKPAPNHLPPQPIPVREYEDWLGRHVSYDQTELVQSLIEQGKGQLHHWNDEADSPPPKHWYLLNSKDSDIENCLMSLCGAQVFQFGKKFWYGLMGDYIWADNDLALAFYLDVIW